MERSWEQKPRPVGEVPMDQPKPVSPMPAPEMSRTDPPAPRGSGKREPLPVRAPTPAVEQLISRQLRAIYDEVVNEPVPDKIVQLLEELERKRAGKS